MLEWKQYLCNFLSLITKKNMLCNFIVFDNRQKIHHLSEFSLSGNFMDDWSNIILTIKSKYFGVKLKCVTFKIVFKKENLLK